MNKLFSFLLLCIGLAGGIFVGANYPNWILRGEQKALLSAYSDLDLSPCSALSFSRQDMASRTACYDGQLMNHALTKQNLAACSDIKNADLAGVCIARVNRLQNLSGHEAKFCQGISNDPLCLDLANLLVAQESKGVGNCGAITNSNLQQTCIALVSGGQSQGQAVEPPRQTLNDDGSLVVQQFGLTCAATDQVCLEARPTFNEAIRSSDISLCNNVGFFLSLCQSEVRLYQSLLVGNTGPCEAGAPAEVCQIDLRIAQALETGDASLCDTLAEAPALACRNTVSTATEKRFDYAS